MAKNKKKTRTIRINAPKHYNPGKGRPIEELAYISPREKRALLYSTDHTAEMTKHGILSFADDSASSVGGNNAVSRGDASQGTTGSNQGGSNTGTTGSRGAGTQSASSRTSGGGSAVSSGGSVGSSSRGPVGGNAAGGQAGGGGSMGGGQNRSGAAGQNAGAKGGAPGGGGGQNAGGGRPSGGGLLGGSGDRGPLGPGGQNTGNTFGGGQPAATSPTGARGAGTQEASSRPAPTSALLGGRTPTFGDRLRAGQAPAQQAPDTDRPAIPGGAFDPSRPVGLPGANGFLTGEQKERAQYRTAFDDGLDKISKAELGHFYTGTPVDNLGLANFKARAVEAVAPSPYTEDHIATLAELKAWSTANRRAQVAAKIAPSMKKASSAIGPYQTTVSNIDTIGKQLGYTDDTPIGVNEMRAIAGRMVEQRPSLGDWDESIGKMPELKAQAKADFNTAGYQSPSYSTGPAVASGTGLGEYSGKVAAHAPVSPTTGQPTTAEKPFGTTLPGPMTPDYGAKRYQDRVAPEERPLQRNDISALNDAPRLGTTVAGRPEFPGMAPTRAPTFASPAGPNLDDMQPEIGTADLSKIKGSYDPLGSLLGRALPSREPEEEGPLPNDDYKITEYSPVRNRPDTPIGALPAGPRYDPLSSISEAPRQPEAFNPLSGIRTPAPAEAPRVDDFNPLSGIRAPARAPDFDPLSGIQTAPRKAYNPLESIQPPTPPSPIAKYELPAVPGEYPGRGLVSPIREFAPEALPEDAPMMTPQRTLENASTYRHAADTLARMDAPVEAPTILGEKPTLTGPNAPHRQGQVQEEGTFKTGPVEITPQISVDAPPPRERAPEITPAIKERIMVNPKTDVSEDSARKMVERYGEDGVEVARLVNIVNSAMGESKSDHTYNALAGAPRIRRRPMIAETDIPMLEA